MIEQFTDGALVLLSGGQDSTTCLAWALDRFPTVETIGFDYRQRHSVELECRASVREGLAALRPDWAKKLGSDHMLDLATLASLGETAMTHDVEIHMTAANLPNTFVPGRNLLFLTFAATLAYRRGLRHIVTGVCETDYSGYPDCRDDTLKALQVALNLGMEKRFVWHRATAFNDPVFRMVLDRRLGGDVVLAFDCFARREPT